MKKVMKKLAFLLTGVLCIGTLSGCSKFDASAYVKAILDNAYLNDSTGVVELEIYTAEEAAALYEKGMNAKVDSLLKDTVISDALKSEYYDFYKDLYSNVKYTVGEAVEVDETTMEVAITYERINVYTDAVAAYEAQIANYVTEWSEIALSGEEAPSDEVMNEQFFTTLKDYLKENLADATYEAPATTTIRVELIDEVWTPNQEDLMNFEYALFDYEGL